MQAGTLFSTKSHGELLLSIVLNSVKLKATIKECYFQSDM